MTYVYVKPHVLYPLIDTHNKGMFTSEEEREHYESICLGFRNNIWFSVPRFEFVNQVSEASLLVLELEHRAVYIKLNNERMYLMYFFL